MSHFPEIIKFRLGLKARRPCQWGAAPLWKGFPGVFSHVLQSSAASRSGTVWRWLLARAPRPGCPPCQSVTSRAHCPAPRIRLPPRREQTSRGLSTQLLPLGQWGSEKCFRNFLGSSRGNRCLMTPYDTVIDSPGGGADACVSWLETTRLHE